MRKITDWLPPALRAGPSEDPAAPRLLDVLLHTSKPVNQALDRTKHGMKKRPLPFKDAVHKTARWFGNGEHKREEDHDLCNTQQSHKTTSISVGPTVRVASVHRFAAFLLPDGSPTLKTISVGPTVRVALVHRFAAFLLPDGSPTLKSISVGPRNVPDEATRTSDK